MRVWRQPYNRVLVVRRANIRRRGIGDEGEPAPPPLGRGQRPRALRIERRQPTTTPRRAATAGIVLPANFVSTEHGGYALGLRSRETAPTQAIPQNTGSANCSLVTGVVRDFKNRPDDGNTGHPDFGIFSGIVPTPGLVPTPLGSDSKPVFAGICDSPRARAAVTSWTASS